RRAGGVALPRFPIFIPSRSADTPSPLICTRPNCPFAGPASLPRASRPSRALGVGPLTEERVGTAQGAAAATCVSCDGFARRAQLDAPFDVRLFVRGEAALKLFDLRQPRGGLPGRRRRTFQPRQLEPRLVRRPVDVASVLDGNALVRKGGHLAEPVLHVGVLR